MADEKITIYGTAWCGDCLRTRRYFDRYKVDYQWVDIDQDRGGAEFVISTNRGMRSVPTIVFVDGSMMIEPSPMILEQKLKQLQPPE